MVNDRLFADECSEVAMIKPKLSRQIIAGLSATLPFLLVGYHLSWASPSLPKLQAPDSSVFLTSDQGSWVVSCFNIGTCIGALYNILLIDRVGRKWSLLLSGVPFVISGVLLGVASSYWWFIAARILAGYGAGMIYVISSMYVGEISHPSIRGALASTASYMINFGILVNYCVGPWVDQIALAGVGLAWIILFISSFIWMPESPYFLIIKNRRKQAMESLRWFQEKDDVTTEVAEIESSIRFDQENAGTLKDMILVPGNRKALCIILGLVAAQHCSGIHAILSYISQIFEAAGSNLNSSVSVIIVGVVQLAIAVICVFIVDLTGRKPLLLISSIGSAISLGGVALYFQLRAGGTDVSSISWLPLTCMIGYIIAYTIGFGTLYCVILSEIFPYNLKPLAFSTAGIAGAFIGGIVPKVYQVLTDRWGIHASFWGFSGITLLSTLFIIFVIPETKQRSLQEIQEKLHKKKAPRIRKKSIQ